MPYQIAHRGWSQGKDENTCAAFQRAHERGMHGVEFDVRWSEERQELVVCHYTWQEKHAESLEQVLSFLATKNFSILLLELKEYHPRLWEELKRLLHSYQLIEKTIIFAFPRVAKKFPWGLRDGMRLGIISMFPWTVRGCIKLKPSVVLFGYNQKWWTQLFFRLVWWDAWMRRLFRVHPDVVFIAGVAQHEKHTIHLESLEGLHAYTVDKDDE